MKLIQYIGMLCILLLACKNSSENTTQNTQDAIQTAWDEMMVIHDEVMPKMSEITRLRKQITAQDSTSEIISQLTNAEDGMWDWMNTLTPLEALKEMEEVEALELLKTEMSEVTEVSKMMNKSIEAGKTLLTTTKPE